MVGRPFSTRRCGLIPVICTPKALIVISLLLWISGNGSNAGRSHKNLRLRAPPGYLQHGSAAGSSAFFRPPFGATSSYIGPTPDPSEEQGMISTFVGNVADTDGEDDLESPKRKKDCGGMPPSIATRTILKRSFFAATKEEMEKKLKEEAKREKREVKRTETNNEPSLPWTCETKYEWGDMGADHYPRFVRTANCKTRSCFNGFFRCRPRRYKTKVLKRVSLTDSASCEDDDVSLPESLRSQWKFITVTISLCCDCVGRIPGTLES